MLTLALFLLGELSGEERSDEAAQFVGKRAGSAGAMAQAGAKRRPEHGEVAPGGRATPPIRQNKSGRPKAARWFSLIAES